ncbi:MAG TPA: hypothetical protein VJT09_08195 [Pyrinomonadaceae bacterium]|nr:hypothetical protein [Pyrinomonadaceae bacterium]
MRERIRFERELQDLGINLSGGPLREREVFPEAEIFVTNGQFGKALSGIPDKVIKLLKLSKTFMAMVAQLDKRYVNIWLSGQHNSALTRRFDLATGTISGGTFDGRRLMNVQVMGNNSRFTPHGSPDSTGYYDAMTLERPDPRETRRWVEVIAHETTHAFNFVTRKGAPAANVADRIRASVNEEAGTRKTEAKILSEIIATKVGKQELSKFSSSTGSPRPQDIERDFFPTEPKRTYLEHFVLSELRNEAIRTDQLDSRDTDVIAQLVNNIPLDAKRADEFLRTGKFLASEEKILDTYKTKEYPKHQFALFVIGARWNSFSAQHSTSDPDFEKAREKLLQEHARAFFRNVITYTPN